MEFRESLIKHFNFSEADWQETISRFHAEKLPAKTFFLEKGKVADRIALIQSGLMRSFFYNDHADDITTHFFREGNVVISMKSFNLQVPSEEYIVAMEECEVLIATYNDMNELAEKIPAWKKIISTVDHQKFNQQMKRSIQLQTLTAAERYQMFMEKHPEILRRVALKHVASYLGIDIATLSRIRKKI